MSILEIVILSLMGLGLTLFITIGCIKTFRKKKNKKEDENEEVRL